MKKAAWAGLFILGQFICSLYGIAKTEKKDLDRIEVKALFNFRDVDTNTAWENIFILKEYAKIFSAQDESFYFLDSKNHRILMADKKGILKKHIGRIGQSDKTFFWPSSIAIHDRRLHVVDQTDKKIKTFDLEGNFIKAFEIPDAWNMIGFAVDPAGQYLAATIFPKKFPQKKLVSVFDTNGRKISEFGEPIPQENISAFFVINQCTILADQNAYYLAFHSIPWIKVYSHAGVLQRTIDLSTKNISDIASIDATRGKAGLQDYVKLDPKGVKTAKYLNGAAIDAKGNLYYATVEKSILMINPAGEIEKQIRLTKDGADLNIWRIFIVADERLAVVSGDAPSKQTGFYLVSF